jgi:hypothetical protein
MNFKETKIVKFAVCQGSPKRLTNRKGKPVFGKNESEAKT